MSEISNAELERYRARTFRTAPGLSLKSREGAVEHVQERGFIFFWPITGHPLPSLWAAVAGDRPVADAHDDPGHITWDWKDSLLDKRRWYYAKVLRKKSTIISLEVAPYFYALSENYGSFEDDYLTLYEQGRMTREARVVYESLLYEGPLDSPALRRAANLTSRESDGPYNRAMLELQIDFKVLPTGVTRSGGWNYSFLYDIPARYYPSLAEEARHIGEREAHRKLGELYFRSLGAAPVKDLARLFGWNAKQNERVIQELVESGVLVRGLQGPEKKGEWAALNEFYT